jgi:hypothetical protein
MKIDISTELYLTLKKIINVFDETELRELSIDGWVTEHPRLKSESYRNEYVRRYKSGSWYNLYDYNNLVLRVISHEDKENNRLEIKMAVVGGSDELLGKILVYNVFKANKHMLTSFYAIDERIEVYLVTLYDYNCEERTLLNGQVLYRPYNEIDISRLYVNKPGKKETELPME